MAQWENVIPPPAAIVVATSRPILRSPPPNCFTPTRKRKKARRWTAGFVVSIRLGSEDHNSLLQAALTTASICFQRPGLALLAKHVAYGIGEWQGLAVPVAARRARPHLLHTEHLGQMGLGSGGGSPYLERPGVPDCTYYIHTRSCGYGVLCCAVPCCADTIP